MATIAQQISRRNARGLIALKHARVSAYGRHWNPFHFGDRLDSVRSLSEGLPREAER
jgi:hypothetical protein